MKKRIIISISILLAVFSVSAQKRDFKISNDKLMDVGVYYYPEHWDSAQWERDIANIAALGFNFIHMSEFAWVFMEPTEGKYDFVWLDKNVELARKYGLKVILCTPSSTPPAWLATKHPDIFARNTDGIDYEHGDRGRYSSSSEVYKKYVSKIVQALAKRYGNDTTVVGWQIDNEPLADDDYSTAALKAFRVWLQKKYNDISNLNKAWGLNFWGTKYNNFAQILLPKKFMMGGISPHWVLDYKRFLSDQKAAFLTLQSEALKKYIHNNQFVTTNYQAMNMNIDSRSAKLDINTFTLYPVWGGHNIGEDGYRMGFPTGIELGTQFHKPYGGTTGIMELQPGQVNWGSVNPQIMPGAVRMWLWHAYAAGNSFVCTYRYRQPLYGSELYHYGIVGTDGVTLSQGGKEYVQFISELNQLRQYINKDKQTTHANPETALLWNYDNYWNLEADKQTKKWSTLGHFMKYLETVKMLGQLSEVISENADFNKYKVLIAPSYQLLDADLISRFEKYVSQGGNLVLTCRSGQKDRNGHLWEGPYAAPLMSLIGVKLDCFDLLPDNRTGHISAFNKTFEWSTWGDILSPKDDTESLSQYADNFYKSKTAASYRKFGKGSVTYIGVDASNSEFEKSILAEVYKRIGIQTKNFPEGIVVNYRDGFGIAVNYSSSMYKMDLPENATILKGNKSLMPAEVLIWKE